MAVASRNADIHEKFIRFPASIREDMELWFKNSNEVKIFITGRTGCGKSTLVNGLVGAKCAMEGGTLNPETSHVTSYNFKRGDLKVIVWDSPGLHDGTSKEEKYLKDMLKKCHQMDVCIYCISMMQTRYFKECPDTQIMKKLTETFGKELWKNTLFVLTFANIAEDTDSTILEAEDAEKPELFQKKVQKLAGIITDTLLKEIGIDKKDIVKDGEDYVAVVPTGHYNIPALLDRSHWLSPLWFSTLYKTHPRAQPALIKLNRHRIVANKSQIHEDDLKRFLEEQPIIFSEKGSEIGEKYGQKELGEKIGFDFPTKYDFDSNDIELNLAYDLRMKLKIMSVKLREPVSKLIKKFYRT